MTGADLERMALEVHSAEQTGIRTVSLIAGDEGVDLEVAYREGRRIQEIRQTYQERLVADRRQVELLTTQQERLSTLLAQIEREYADYQSQVWQLDRQIDAIERNDRLIALTASQQEILRGFDAPGDIDNLRSIESRLAELQAVQEGTLQSLTEQHRRGEYEHRARARVKDGDGPDGFATPAASPFAEFLPRTRPHEVSVASPLLTTPS
jgi:predicted RNase H-like nuclease (RuvC/YqgF family)